MSLWRFYCYMTDHRYHWGKTDRPSPYCRRCGADGYWPSRRTIRGFLGRLRLKIKGLWLRLVSWITSDEDDIPF